MTTVFGFKLNGKKRYCFLQAGGSQGGRRWLGELDNVPWL